MRSDRRIAFLVCGMFALAGAASAQTVSTVAGTISPQIGIQSNKWSATSASGVAIDSSLNIYVSLKFLNEVWEINSNGTIIKVIGTGVTGYTGDNGTASGARLNQPNGIAVDSSGNLYIADTGNNVVRKVTASTGTITTVAGTGTTGFGGDGGAASAATLSGPTDVAVGSLNNLFIADAGNQVIRKMFRDFRGRDPDISAMLADRGLTKR